MSTPPYQPGLSNPAVRPTFDASDDPTPDAVAEDAKQEFLRWSEACQRAKGIVPTGPPKREMRPHPAPEATGGLPAGWTLASQRPRPGTAGATWAMARRAREIGGGWVVLLHWDDDALTEFLFANESLADLYVDLVATTKVMKANDIATASLGWYKELLVGLYDPTDPDEAAEQMLFALSGVMRTPPKAAR